MNSNGVGFLNTQPCLVWNREGAPWMGLESKFRESHRLSYSDWSYCTRDEGIPITVILEGLIRWEDDQEV